MLKIAQNMLYKVKLMSPFLKLISTTFISSDNTQLEMPFTAVAWLERGGCTVRNASQSEKITSWILFLMMLQLSEGWSLELTVFAVISVPFTPPFLICNTSGLNVLFSVLGTVGFFACFFFVRRIYSNISVPEKPVTTWMVEHCWSHNFPLGLFQSCSTTVGCESLEPNFGESLALGCYTWVLT